MSVEPHPAPGSSLPVHHLGTSPVHVIKRLRLYRSTRRPFSTRFVPGPTGPRCQMCSPRDDGGDLHGEHIRGRVDHLQDTRHRLPVHENVVQVDAGNGVLLGEHESDTAPSRPCRGLQTSPSPRSLTFATSPVDGHTGSLVVVAPRRATVHPTQRSASRMTFGGTAATTLICRARCRHRPEQNRASVRATPSGSPHCSHCRIEVIRRLYQREAGA